MLPFKQFQVAFQKQFENTSINYAEENIKYTLKYRVYTFQVILNLVDTRNLSYISFALSLSLLNVFFSELSFILKLSACFILNQVKNITIHDQEFDVMNQTAQQIDFFCVYRNVLMLCTAVSLGFVLQSVAILEKFNQKILNCWHFQCIHAPLS